MSDGVLAHFVVPPPIAAGALLDPVPIKPSGTALWDKLSGEAEADFAAKNYDAAVVKIRELLAVAGDDGKTAPLEPLYFKLGLVNLFNGRFPEAETAFNDCIKRFPKGEYTSRAFLGLGRACMKIDDPQIRWRAIDALKTAAKDPQCRPEAILWLGEVYSDFRKTEEALAVYRGYMGKEVRTFQQTAAAVALIGLLADRGRMDELSVQLGNLTRQVGVRDSIAWFSNEMIVRGDEMLADESFESALIIYRSIPPRREILEIQTGALKAMRKKLAVFESKRSNALQLLSNLKVAIEHAEICMKAVEEKTDLDAALLMRRGRCLFYLDRYEEALLCFRTILSKYPDATDAENAAYAELHILNHLKNFAGIKDRFDQFQQKYPQSDKAEQAAMLTVEALRECGRWRDAAVLYHEMELKHPRSDMLDRYVFCQGLAYFNDADFKLAIPQFERFLTTFPKSVLVDRAIYYLAESYFLNRQYQEALKAASTYVEKFPKERFAGEMHHRIAFIELNDRNADLSDKIIRDLGDFLAANPDDIAKGSMLCLLADTYKRKGESDKALDYYKQAVWTGSPDDVIQYALDSATAMMQGNKDWKGIAKLHRDFITKNPKCQLLASSVRWLVQAERREGEEGEAADALAIVLKASMSDPSNEHVEAVIDELVKSMVPRKKPEDLDIDELDKQLVERLTKIAGPDANATAKARIFYARARLAQWLERDDRCWLFLKGNIVINAKDLSVLSPQLLSKGAEALLKLGDVDDAARMFQRLKDQHGAKFGNVASIGLGNAALARKKPEEALKIFNGVLENQPAPTEITDATIGKLQALVDLNKDDEAMKLAIEVLPNEAFKGESSARVYLMLGGLYEKKAAAGGDAKEFLQKALGIYQRVLVAYPGSPELSEEAFRRADKVKKKL